MNTVLKAALIGKFDSQIAAARALGIREWRLSRILRGWDYPRKREVQLLARAVGKKAGRIARQTGRKAARVNGSHGESGQNFSH